jgi:UDP-N-acetylglucosamine 2-epimerase (non-hydrolysing)
MAAVFQALSKRTAFAPRLIHTGQHFSSEMSQAFFNDLQLPAPHVHLNCTGGTPTHQLASIMMALEPVLQSEVPRVVIVVGDVTSTLAAALTATRLDIPVAHVEAGLRSFDRRMPEETNRILTDHVSTFLFASEASGVENLRAEGADDGRVYMVGNVMIDTLLRFRERAAATGVLERLGLERKSYAVATLHRPSNVDDAASLRKLVRVLQRVGGRLPVVFPIHPRTSLKLAAAGIDTTGLLTTPPLGYLEFLQLMSEARLMLTDSGGIQEETTILQVPCLTLRENTERPATITCGTNRLVGVDPEAIAAATEVALNESPRASQAPPLWDGRASHRIADILEKALAG